jgi:hypothetical protein
MGACGVFTRKSGCGVFCCCDVGVGAGTATVIVGRGRESTGLVGMWPLWSAVAFGSCIGLGGSALGGLTMGSRAHSAGTVLSFFSGKSITCAHGMLRCGRAGAVRATARQPPGTAASISTCARTKVGRAACTFGSAAAHCAPGGARPAAASRPSTRPGRSPTARRTAASGSCEARRSRRPARPWQAAQARA